MGPTLPTNPVPKPPHGLLSYKLTKGYAYIVCGYVYSVGGAMKILPQHTLQLITITTAGSSYIGVQQTQGIHRLLH